MLEIVRLSAFYPHRTKYLVALHPDNFILSLLQPQPQPHSPTYEDECSRTDLTSHLRKLSQERNSQLPTHPTWTRWRTNIRRHRNCLKFPVSFRDRLPKRHALSASPHWIRSILYIRAIDILSVVCEDRTPNPEIAVWTVGSGL